MRVHMLPKASYPREDGHIPKTCTNQKHDVSHIRSWLTTCYLTKRDFSRKLHKPALLGGTVQLLQVHAASIDAFGANFAKACC